MALLNIVKEGDPLLRKQSRPIEEITPRILTLLDDMKDTMHAANGCGLAAVQVGALKRVVVIDVGDGLLELINPEIVERKGEQCDVEGCLSLPGESGYTLRPAYVRVRAQNRNGEWCEYSGEELLARAFCHELDHLDGHLYTDRLAPKDAVARMRAEHPDLED